MTLSRLALAVSSPKLQVLCVTTAWGDTDLRARLTARFLQQTGHSNIPVFAGPSTHASSTFTQARWTQGGRAQPRAGQMRSTSWWITIQRNPGQVTLISVSPFSNVGALIDRDPAVFRQLNCVVHRRLTPRTLRFVVRKGSPLRFDR